MFPVFTGWTKAFSANWTNHISEKKRSQCLCIHIFIYFSLKIYFCCNSDREGNEKNKWTLKLNHFLFPQPHFRASNPLFKPEHNDQLINRGLGQNRPLSIGECPFELKRREGLNEEYEITWLYALSLSRNCCARWKVESLLRWSTVGNQRNNTNVLCFRLCEKKGVGGNSVILSLCTLFFICVRGSLWLEGACGPRPGCYVLQFWWEDSLLSQLGHLGV